MYCEMVQQCVYIFIRSVARVSDGDRRQCSQHSIAILHVLDAYMHKYMHTWTWYRTFLRHFNSWLDYTKALREFLYTQAPQHLYKER